MDVFEQEFSVRWSDLDPNFHMRHSAYTDLCAATRFSYLESLGMTHQKFAEMKIGPILFNENMSYFNEVRPNDKVIVNVKISGQSKDGRKWKMRHEIKRKSDGKLAAQLEVSGAWFDVVNRKVTTAPATLLEKVESLPRTEDFQEL